MNNNQVKKMPFNGLISLIIWCISMSVLSVALLLIGGNQHFSPYYRITVPVVSFIVKISDGKYLADKKAELESAAWQEQGLREEAAMEKQKKELDNNLLQAETSLPWLAVVINYDQDIQEALAAYEEAKATIERWKSGEKFKSEAVLIALQKLTSLNKNMRNNFQTQYVNTRNMDSKQKAKLLGQVLQKTAQGVEYRVDSIGFNGNNLIINGYWQFDPKKFKINIEDVMSNLGLVKKFDKSKHKLAICFLRSDRKEEGDVFYAEKDKIDIEILREQCGFGNRSSYYSTVEFPNAWSAQLACSRLSMPIANLDLVVIDMRPQSWCKWSIVTPCAEAEKIRAGKDFTVKPPQFKNEGNPAVIYYKHSSITEYLHRDLAADITAGNAVSAPLKSVREVFTDK